MKPSACLTSPIAGRQADRVGSLASGCRLQSKMAPWGNRATAAMADVTIAVRNIFCHL
jgi:hypothetical protein